MFYFMFGFMLSNICYHNKNQRSFLKLKFCLNSCLNSCLDLCYTPPNSEIICGQNVGTKVVFGMILFFEKKTMLKI